jgi:hypothetical protein
MLLSSSYIYNSLENVFILPILQPCYRRLSQEVVTPSFSSAYPSDVFFDQVPSPHEHRLILPIYYSSAHNATSTSSAAEQYELSISRTSAYVEDPTASHVQHRHKSTKQSKESHTSSMKAYLDNFDATMATEMQTK